MTDLSDRLVTDLAVCEAATDGPWEVLKERVVTEDMDMVTPRLHSAPDAEFTATARTGYPLALRALQAVMGLHSQTFDTPWRRAHPGQPGCSECVDQLDGPALWPCPTIQRIREVYGDEQPTY